MGIENSNSIDIIKSVKETFMNKLLELLAVIFRVELEFYQGGGNGGDVMISSTVIKAGLLPFFIIQVLFRSIYNVCPVFFFLLPRIQVDVMLKHMCKI